MSKMVRLCVVDDHPVVKEGLVAMLETEPDFEVVGSFDDPLEALERLDELRPDVVILDLQMPGLDGYQLITQLRKGTRAP